MCYLAAKRIYLPVQLADLILQLCNSLIRLAAFFRVIVRLATQKVVCISVLRVPIDIVDSDIDAPPVAIATDKVVACRHYEGER